MHSYGTLREKMGRSQRFHCLCQASKNTFTTNSFLDTSADELCTSKEITFMKWKNYPEIRHLFSISLRERSGNDHCFLSPESLRRHRPNTSELGSRRFVHIDGFALHVSTRWRTGIGCPSSVVAHGSFSMTSHADSVRRLSAPRAEPTHAPCLHIPPPPLCPT